MEIGELTHWWSKLKPVDFLGSSASKCSRNLCPSPSKRRPIRKLIIWWVEPRWRQPNHGTYPEIPDNTSSSMGFCTMVSMEFHGWPRLATFLHPSSLLQAFFKPSWSLWKEFSWDPLTFFEPGRSQENFLSLPNIQDQQASLVKETEEFNIQFKCKWTISNPFMLSSNL